MPRTELEQEFIADHRRLTQSFQSVIAALENNDTAELKSRADELDRIAGPHIAFEEHVLNPQVEGDRGKGDGTNLLREHQVARSALHFIQKQDSHPMRHADRARVLEQLRVGLEHAVSCGSLLNNLTVMDDAEQDELLNLLRNYRQRNLRWTNLDAKSIVG